METKKTIEVNGKSYDAVTGVLVKHGHTAQARRGQNIDGFFRSRTTITPTLKTPPNSDRITVLAAPAPAPKPHKQPARGVNHAKRHVPQTSKTVDIRVRSGVQHSQKLTVHRTPVTPNHTKSVKPQTSQTLMRAAVKRPAPSFHKQAQTKGTLQHAVPSLIVPKKSVASVDESRLVRAQQVKRSPLVAHHTNPQVSKVLPQYGPLAVTPLPANPNPQSPVPGTAPAPQPHNKPDEPPKPTDIFEHALANANHFVDLQAHKMRYRKKARRHVTSMAAGTLALLVIAGFAFYQNSAGLQFKVASFHAGVATHMPNLKAAGFAYDGAKADGDTLVVGFSSPSGNYRLSQQATNLSEQDVINDLSATDASGHPDYTTVHAGSTTVYRFGANDATWVQDGTWYTVNGTGSLTDQQVTSLVDNI
jgi:hypothetical protein